MDEEDDSSADQDSFGRAVDYILEEYKFKEKAQKEQQQQEDFENGQWFF